MLQRRRPAHRRYNFVLKTAIFLCMVLLHAGLVAFLAKWLVSTTAFSKGSDGSKGEHTGNMGGESGHHGGHGHQEAGHDTGLSPEHFTMEGVVRAVYKDPGAEFIQVDPCGSSAAEAREKGCMYGMLYGAWLPKECYDEETEANFKKYTNWKFWLQGNRTEERSWDDVARGEYDYVLVEWEYHQRHCAEMNRRIFTAMSRRGLKSIDSYLSRWQHIDHCAHSAMEQRPTHELNAILWRKFPDCGVVRWKNQAHSDV